MTPSISSSALALYSGANAPSADTKDKIHQAAGQFESLLIGQLLKTSHDGNGWLGTDGDDSGETGVEFGEEQFARMLASSGGLHLAPLIEKGLRNETASNHSAPAAS